MFSTAPSLALGAPTRGQELQENVVAVGPWSQTPTLQPHTLTQYAGPEPDRWMSPKTESQYAPEGRPGKSGSKAFLWAAVLTGSPGLLQGTASS